MGYGRGLVALTLLSMVPQGFYEIKHVMLPSSRKPTHPQWQVGQPNCFDGLADPHRHDAAFLVHRDM